MTNFSYIINKCIFSKINNYLGKHMQFSLYIYKILKLKWFLNCLPSFVQEKQIENLT